MLAITVNGQETKLNIGCRTFVGLDVLLKIIEADCRNVHLNGIVIRSREFGKTTVKGGDSLLLEQ